MQEAFFGFELPTRILFGSGSLGNLGFELSTQNWRSALVVTDRGVREAGLLTRVEAQLQEIPYEVYDQIVPNPTVDCIERALPMAHEREVLIAVGGGSVLDSAKVLNLLRSHGGKVIDYEGNDTVPDACGPLVAIPTTAGTGSEVTFIAMFTVPERRQKMPIRSRYLAPTLAIIDPELTYTLPPAITAQTGLDALTHAIEALVASTAQPLTDLLALQAIPLINRYLPVAVQEQDNLEARANLSYAALLAGIAFNNSGVGLAHAIAHALGGLYDLPHGLCCALALPTAMKFNLACCSKQYEQVAQALGTRGAEAGIERVKRLRSRVGIPARLQEIGILQPDLEQLVRLTLADGSILFNPVQPSPEDLQILLPEIF